MVKCCSSTLNRLSPTTEAARARNVQGSHQCALAGIRSGAAGNGRRIMACARRCGNGLTCLHPHPMVYLRKLGIIYRLVLSRHRLNFTA